MSRTFVVGELTRKLEVWRDLPSVGTVAACGFAGVLFKLINSDLVMSLLKAIISKAFRLSF